MQQMETSLKFLVGRKAKLFLQKVTKTTLGAIAGGAGVTAVLQSSSMVSLMVLAFVGAGVFSLKNALAIILGANIGTLVSGWMLATLGFNTNIELLAHPAVFMGGFMLILFNHREQIKQTGHFLLGFGLLFIGLSFMKTAMESQVQQFDFSKYEAMPLYVFLGIGFIITLLVQSSSVTTALTLSALHVGAVSFPAAVALVLGSETGTTIKIVLSSIGGSVVKKQIAIGNLVFNLILTLIAFVLISPLLNLILHILNIQDPLIALITFSTVVNLSGVLFFIPLLHPYVKFLKLVFKGAEKSAASYIQHADLKDPQTALELFKLETAYFLHNCMVYSLGVFEVKCDWLNNVAEYNRLNEIKKFEEKTDSEKYDLLKLIQGELQAFYLALKDKLNGKDLQKLDQMVSSARSSMHATKSMKDIKNDIMNLSQSSKNLKYALFIKSKEETVELYRYLSLMLENNQEVDYQELKRVFNKVESNFMKALTEFYAEAKQAQLNELDLTTFINFNRELFTANKAMIMAVKEQVLNTEQAITFNEVPVYKT
ncbi:MAG: Na/Pi symporter [Bacteroidia bacterium]|nr:Na/Pi symporter [Bacteroidia bacterium]